MKRMDWEQLLQKWIVLFELKPEERKELYDSLHVQTQKTLGLIAQSAQEKALEYCASMPKDSIPKEWFISTSSLQAWGGYMLYLMQHYIDPVESKTSSRTHEPTIDKHWVAEYEKNMCHDYIDATNPIVTLFLDKATAIRIEQFLLNNAQFYAKEYKLVANIRNCFGWAAVQGYVVGLLEFSDRNK